MKIIFYHFSWKYISIVYWTFFSPFFTFFFSCVWNSVGCFISCTYRHRWTKTFFHQLSWNYISIFFKKFFFSLFHEILFFFMRKKKVFFIFSWNSIFDENLMVWFTSCASRRRASWAGPVPGTARWQQPWRTPGTPGTPGRARTTPCVNKKKVEIFYNL